MIRLSPRYLTLIFTSTPWLIMSGAIGGIYQSGTLSLTGLKVFEWLIESRSKLFENSLTMP
jgi:hypothetical protein